MVDHSQNLTVTIIEIAIIIILIVLSALFSSSETALTVVSPHRVRALVEEGNKRAVILEKVISRKEKMLSVILICNNIVNLSASALTTVVMNNLFGSVAVTIGTAVLTVLIIIFGEIAPKTMATKRAEKMALKYCGIIRILMIVFTPVAAVINFLAGGVLRIFGVRKDEKAETITEGELKAIVAVSQEEGVIESDEEDIINNIFDFSDTVVREVMVPRINVTALNVNNTYEEVMAIFQTDYFTRYPVFDENADKVVGMVNVKDLLFYDHEKIGDFKVSELMREVEYTFEQKHLSELFLEMKEKHLAMMVVIDEYGDTAGIVTLEDIIEEIVGDIKDEYDQAEEKELVEVAPSEYEIQGYMSLSDVNDMIGTNLSSEDFDSIGGLMIEKLGRLPEQGETVTISDVTRDMDDNPDTDEDKITVAINLTAIKTNGAKIETVKLNII